MTREPKLSEITEAAVAAALMDYLIADGWDCYPEVECAEGRADIVAVRAFPFMPHRKCVHIFETKTSWSLDLLEQAIRRRRYAHFVTIAAPSKISQFYQRLCNDFGIGTMRVFKKADGNGSQVFHICEWQSGWGSRPKMQRHRHGDRYHGPDRTLEALHEDQKRFAPGTTSASGYSTPWRRTMDAAAKFVAEHPGCTVKELVLKIDHHYASVSGAKQGFLTWLEKRDDIDTRREGGCIRFYPPGAPSIVPALNLNANHQEYGK